MNQELNAIHPSLHAVVDCQVLQVSQVGCGIRRKQLALCANRDALSCAKVKKKKQLETHIFLV